MENSKDYTFSGYRSDLKEAARLLRREATPAEERLWKSYCRHSPHKFYRQRVIDRFIVDFYCSKAKLVIELDGMPHFTTDGKQRDLLRTEILEHYGIKVIRFTNSEVMDHFQEVCDRIDREILDRT